MKTTTLFTALSLALGMFFTSCCDDSVCIRGEGGTETRVFDLNDFSGVELSEAGTVTISQGDKQEVRVTAQPNILDHLQTRVSNGIWDIDFGSGCFKRYDLTVDIVVPNLDLVALSGSGDIIVRDFEDQRFLDLNISGSGSIRLNAFDNLEKMDVRISGSGDIFITDSIPSVNNLDLSVSGSGNFNGYPLETKNCDISISGSADCFVYATSNLDVSISGSGTVFYHGYPHITTTISGSGKVVDAN